MKWKLWSNRFSGYRKRTEWRVERYVGGQNFLLESVGLEMVVNDLYGFLLNNKP